MPMIQTRSLRKIYGKTMALERLDLDVDEAEAVGFIGPNGAGKTTTLRILATLLRPSAGIARINGVDVTKHPYEVKKEVGYMPDSFGVYDGMRLNEYLDFFGAAYKIPVAKRRSIIADVLELTDLTRRADEYVTGFSRGMKQRACLAKTLIHDPKVLLLDEPASGLDPRARIEIRELLKTLRSMGKTILISSHILSELADMCNKIAIIENGKLLAVGSLDDIYEEMHKSSEIRMVALEGADRAEEMLNRMEGIQHVERGGDEFIIDTEISRSGHADILAALVNGGVRVASFAEQKETLENVFMQITNGNI